MCEEERNVQNTEEENQNLKRQNGKSWRAKLVMLCVCAMMMAASASATSETGMEAVAAQASTATTWIGNVFDMITGNPYLATLMAFGLLSAAIRVFRRAKRASR